MLNTRLCRRVLIIIRFVVYATVRRNYSDFDNAHILFLILNAFLEGMYPHVIKR